MNNPWEEIKAPSRDVNVRRIDHTHLLNLFWGKNQAGQYMFIFESQAIDKKLNNTPRLTGIEVHVLPVSHQYKKGKVILLLNEKADWEMFLALCCDLVQASRNCSDDRSGLSVIVQRLIRWQEFLKKARRNILPVETIKGLIGEFLFIKLHLQKCFGWENALNFWQGPEGVPQDFCMENCAVEVKCQMGNTLPVIKISSVEQLVTQLPELFLYVVTLSNTTKENEEAINLPDLIKEIREELAGCSIDSLQQFNDMLYLIGYYEQDTYYDFNYQLAGEAMFKVEEGFPRIKPENVHSDISRVSYSINISGCMPFKGTPEWMEEIQ
jgi:hypothetical protein